MDDNAKIVNQNEPPVAPAAQANQARPQTVIRSVGSFNKETEPVDEPISDFIKPSETQPQIDRDIANLGVEARRDEPNIADEHKHIIAHAGPHIHVSASASNKVTMPMSEEEIKDNLETCPNDDSGKWLAALLDKLRKIFRI